MTKGVPGLQYNQKRSPAWCDRVLWRSNLPHKPAKCTSYSCQPSVATSDHKPVAAAFSLPLGAPRQGGLTQAACWCLVMQCSALW